MCEPNRKSKSFGKFGWISLNSIEFRWIWCIPGAFHWIPVAFRCILKVRTSLLRVIKGSQMHWNTPGMHRIQWNSMEFNPNSIEFIEFFALYGVCQFYWWLYSSSSSHPIRPSLAQAVEKHRPGRCICQEWDYGPLRIDYELRWLYKLKNYKQQRPPKIAITNPI